MATGANAQDLQDFAALKCGGEDRPHATSGVEATTEINGDSTIRRVSVNSPQIRRSSSTLSSTPDAELNELSLLDVLTQAASDVLASIPAQRCIVYIYDKAANLLRPQVVVDCHEGQSDEVVESDNAGSEGEITESRDANGNSTRVANTTLVSFPPVVGMVSSCFLQRRCLRMQEPNPHRTFHREYDVPKDLPVDSILCAPVILYRRATAVIQLLNRLNTSGDRIPFETIERATTPQDHKSESSSEVRLRRLKTIKTIVKTGFSTKDEQKLLHFTTHIAQTVEMNMKKIANGRSEAKLREDKAKEALELLNALNGNIIARIEDTEVELLSTNVAEHSGRSIYMRRATITRLPSQKGVLTDMLSALVVVMRLQAIFRGRRHRRAEKFAEELEKFRKQRERMRTLIMMQRVARPELDPKSRVYDKPATPVTKRESRGSSRLRIRTDETRKALDLPSKPPPSKSGNTTPRTPRKQPVVPPPHPPKAPEHIQERMSAKKIQKVFRQHRQRQQRKSVTPVRPCKYSKETASAIKVQSFIRGNLVRKRLRRAMASPRGPHIICLRVASTSTAVASNQGSHESPTSLQLQSRMCIYPMPERSGKPHLMYRRTPISHNIHGNYSAKHRPQNVGQGVVVETRRLVASYKAVENLLPDASVSPCKPRGDRTVAGIIWETLQHELDPPGVEFVRHRRQHESSRQKSARVSSPHTTSVTESRLPALCTSKPAKGLRVRMCQPQLGAGKSTLLCCLLPTQTKRLAGGLEPLVVQAVPPASGRKALKAKQQQQYPSFSAL